MPRRSFPRRGATFPSRYGSLRLVVGPEGITALGWEDSEPSLEEAGIVPDPEGLSPLVARVLARLAGETNTAIPLAPSGTPFQQRVWNALCDIPRGSVASYGALARFIGLPTGARAVAGACAANPIALLIPCHRVVAGNGTLGGYGPGLRLKAAILRDEGVTLFADGTRWVRTRRSAHGPHA